MANSPKTWKPEYATVLRLDVLGSSQREVANALNYSRNQIQRIQKMPQYQEMKQEILSGEQGGIIERTKAQLALILPTAAGVYEKVMTDKDANNRDKISAADSVIDRFVPKISRSQVDAHVNGTIITINLNGKTQEELLGSLEVVTSYSLICSDCRQSYLPDEEHVCGQQPKEEQLSKPLEAYFIDKGKGGALPPSGKTCAVGSHLLYGKQRLIRHHPTLMKYFSKWIPEWADQYCHFLEADISRVCMKHHDEAHQKAKAALQEWWALAGDEQTPETARAVSSECSAGFWGWVGESC